MKIMLVNRKDGNYAKNYADTIIYQSVFTLYALFVLVHFQERFQIDAFSMKTLNAFGWTESLNASKCIHISEIVVTG